jgi:hypothetical protein
MIKIADSYWGDTQTEVGLKRVRPSPTVRGPHPF